MLCTAIVVLVKAYLVGMLVTFMVTSVPLWGILFKEGRIDWSWMIPAIMFAMGSWITLYFFILSLLGDMAAVKND